MVTIIHNLIRKARERTLLAHAEPNHRRRKMVMPKYIEINVPMDSGEDSKADEYQMK
jgi:acyl-coenzyme A thioesterase PaaI-like protein